MTPNWLIIHSRTISSFCSLIAVLLSFCKIVNQSVSNFCVSRVCRAKRSYPKTFQRFNVCVLLICNDICLLNSGLYIALKFSLCPIHWRKLSACEYFTQSRRSTQSAENIEGGKRGSSCNKINFSVFGNIPSFAFW